VFDVLKKFLHSVGSFSGCGTDLCVPGTVFQVPLSCFGDDDEGAFMKDCDVGAVMRGFWEATGIECSTISVSFSTASSRVIVSS
jgi:hypothetical protein